MRFQRVPRKVLARIKPFQGDAFDRKHWLKLCSEYNRAVEAGDAAAAELAREAKESYLKSAQNAGGPPQG